jgi:hypothetical protein
MQRMDTNDTPAFCPDFLFLSGTGVPRVVFNSVARTIWVNGVLFESEDGTYFKPARMDETNVGEDST